MRLTPILSRRANSVSGSWQSWTRSCIARMTSALPKSWSAMHCRGPTATPSVMLPAIAAETLAMLCTSWILHSGAAQVVHVVDDLCLLGVPLRSDFGVVNIDFLQEGRHQDRVTHNVTVIHVPQLRQATVFLQRMPQVVFTLFPGSLAGSWPAQPCAAAFHPPPSQRPGRIPADHRRLLALHLDPSAVAGSLLVHRKTSFDVSTLLLPCAWGETATPPRALPATGSSQRSFSRRIH